MDGILTGALADLDESALLGIVDSSSSQAEYLSRFKSDLEAKAMATVCSVLAVAAESALLQRRTGIALA
jgi:hypothetical protein